MKWKKRNPLDIDWKFIITHQPFRIGQKLRIVRPYSTRIQHDSDGYSFKCFRYAGATVPEAANLAGHEFFDICLNMKGDIAVDVGSHVGSYAIRIAKNFNQVHAFEPLPKAFDLLYYNIKLNNTPNVIPNPVAVSDKSGEDILRVPKYSPTGNTLAKTHYDVLKFTDNIKVKVYSLDDYFKDRKGKVDFVKIDAENHELAVLKGMVNLIHEQHPMVCVEIHHGQTGKDFCNCDVCSWMRETGMKVELHSKTSNEYNVHWVVGT